MKHCEEETRINCIDLKLPEKQIFLEKKNLLSEFDNEVEKAKARSNLGITPLLEELRALIYTKAVDDAGNLKFGSEPTDGRLNEEAYSQVLSSAVIYDTLQKYYTKNELGQEFNYFLRVINQLKQDKINKSEVYTKKQIIDKINDLINQINELIEGSKITVDNSLSEISSNPVQNKVIKQALDELLNRINNIPEIEPSTNIEVDSELSETSENPLQNKVIKSLLDNYITREELYDIQNPLKVTISVSPNIAEYTGVPQNIRITASVKKGSNNINPDTYQIKYKNNTENFNGSYTAQISDKGITVFTINCTYKSESASASGSVNFVLPTYFGFDGTEDFNSVDLTKLDKEIKSNIQSTKTLNNNTTGSYLWIVSPYTLNAVATDQGYTYKVAMVLGGSKDGLNYYRSNSAIDISSLTYYIK